MLGRPGIHTPLDNKEKILRPKLAEILKNSETQHILLLFEAFPERHDMWGLSNVGLL